MPEIDRYLAALAKHDGSDLHLSSGEQPRIRVHGSMKPLAKDPLAAAEVERLLFEILPPRNRREFETNNDTDFAYQLAGYGRFRVNYFRGRLGLGGVFRNIPDTIRSVEELGIPPAVKTFCKLPSGIVLVTGPTGSGKTTTLAAMVDLINIERADHIITIEDPIEYVHRSKRCLVNQREVGEDTNSFARALRAALREDPDVLLVGEMRDLETARIAVEMAETGHLVFATLHTRSAAATVDRLISQFPADEQQQIRIMVANSLRGVIVQTLLKKKSGGRLAAFELLVVTPAVRNHIREAKLHQIPSAMQTGGKYGMVCLNDALLKLVLNGQVEPAEALSKADDRDDLLAKLQVAGVVQQSATGAAPSAPVRQEQAGRPADRGR